MTAHLAYSAPIAPPRPTGAHVTPCAEPDCPSLSRTRGYCGAHYMRVKNAERQAANRAELEGALMRHGTKTAYKKHCAEGIPFPEDIPGGISCGCRRANRIEALAYRTRHQITRIPCATCGKRRAVRPERDNQCAECHQKAEARRLTAERAAERKMNESPPELIYGRWVKVGLVWEWEEYEPESVPDEPYNAEAATCRRCRRPMQRGKRHRMPGVVWHAAAGYCEACNKHVRQESAAS